MKINIDSLPFARFTDFARAQMAKGNGKSVARTADLPEGFLGSHVVRTSTDAAYKLFRPDSEKAENNSVRQLFRKTVSDMFGGEDKIPADVRAAMKMADYGKGRPLTARRIMAVANAIERHAQGENGLTAAFVAGKVVDEVVKEATAGFGKALADDTVAYLAKVLHLSVSTKLDDIMVRSGEAKLNEFRAKVRMQMLGVLTLLPHDAEGLNTLLRDELHFRHTLFTLMDEKGEVSPKRYRECGKVPVEETLAKYGKYMMYADVYGRNPIDSRTMTAFAGRVASKTMHQLADAAEEEARSILLQKPISLPPEIDSEQLRGTLQKMCNAYLTDNISFSRKAIDLVYHGRGPDEKSDVPGLVEKFRKYVGDVLNLAGDDKEVRKIIGASFNKMVVDGQGHLRALDDMANRVAALKDNIDELRTLARKHDRPAIVDMGVDAIIGFEGKAMAKGLFTKLVASARPCADLFAKIADAKRPGEIARGLKELDRKLETVLSDLTTSDIYDDGFQVAKQNLFIRMSILFMTDDKRDALRTMLKGDAVSAFRSYARSFASKGMNGFHNEIKGTVKDEGLLRLINDFLEAEAKADEAEAGTQRVLFRHLLTTTSLLMDALQVPVVDKEAAFKDVPHDLLAEMLKPQG